jgi:hypothetical protein
MVRLFGGWPARKSGLARDKPQAQKSLHQRRSQQDSAEIGSRPTKETRTPTERHGRSCNGTVSIAIGPRANAIRKTPQARGSKSRFTKDLALRGKHKMALFKVDADPYSAWLNTCRNRQTSKIAMLPSVPPPTAPLLEPQSKKPC